MSSAENQSELIEETVRGDYENAASLPTRFVEVGELFLLEGLVHRVMSLDWLNGLSHRLPVALMNWKRVVSISPASFA